MGTNGKGMLLLSGGIDSPVAGYMIVKRGVKIDAVYFHAPPYTSREGETEGGGSGKSWCQRYSGPIYLHVVNFTDIQLYIYEKCPHDELTIIMRRYMMRIAEMIAKGYGVSGADYGRGIGQVASQTMHSLAATDDACEMPVYRPLIGMDKQGRLLIFLRGLGRMRRRFCRLRIVVQIFVAKHPVTKPNLNVIRKHERFWMIRSMNGEDGCGVEGIGGCGEGLRWFGERR